MEEQNRTLKHKSRLLPDESFFVMSEPYQQWQNFNLISQSHRP